MKTLLIIQWALYLYFRLDKFSLPSIYQMTFFLFFFLYIISVRATGKTEQTSATFYSGSVGHRIIVSAYKMLKADMKH